MYDMPVMITNIQRFEKNPSFSLFSHKITACPKGKSTYATVSSGSEMDSILVLAFTYRLKLQFDNSFHLFQIVEGG